MFRDDKMKLVNFLEEMGPPRTHQIERRCHHLDIFDPQLRGKLNKDKRKASVSSFIEDDDDHKDEGQESPDEAGLDSASNIKYSMRSSRPGTAKSYTILR